LIIESAGARKATVFMLQALLTILRENENDKRTKAGLARIEKSAKTLGLSEQEIIELEKFLEYRKNSDETFYPFAR
jgi:hypothetical protein